MRYQKSWFSLPILGSLIIFDILLVFLNGISDLSFISTILISFCTVGAILFPSLKVRVDNQRIYITYFLGLVTNTYYLSDFESVQAVENKNLIAWLYNPRGQYAAVFRSRGGFSFYLPVEDGLKLIPCCRA